MLMEMRMRKCLLVCIWLLASVANAEEVDYTLPDLNGVSHSLSQYQGKWVVVNYWATWCPPCLDEIPDLVAFHDRHKDKDAVVIGINYEDIESEHLNEFVENYFISYPILRSEPLPITPLGPIPGLPTTFLIDPQGRRVARQVGPITGEQLEQFLQRKQADPKQAKSATK
jgi:thiol-disulfide isomerase/thioredoxin